jgi:hypothetical protein
MMRNSFPRTLTPEDRQTVKNWTRGVLIVYGTLALIIISLVSLSQHLANGPKDPGVTAVTATADRNQHSR